MRILGVIITLVLLFSSQLAATNEADLTEEQKVYIAEIQKIWDSLDRKHGEIKLPNGTATLHVPESFYYLDPSDTETVLVKAWGNPPSGQKTLGMLFPEGMTPFDGDAWGVTIEYQEDGYVSDEDADSIDYDELLTQMKKGTEAESKERAAMGYESIELVGWAAKPYYDKASHKLHWAQEYKFGNQEVNTLNYNIRVLGRKGVLILNFIAGVDQLEVINSQVDTVLNIADFDEGARYADFNPDIDEVAAYGLGALVAGKVAAKTGLLAMALLFLKKFWVFLLVGAGAAVKILFRRGKKNKSNEDTDQKE